MLCVAIKKRSCESSTVALPDGRRLNNRVNGVESLSKDCSKKSKICMVCTLKLQYIYLIHISILVAELTDWKWHN